MPRRNSKLPKSLKTNKSTIKPKDWRKVQIAAGKPKPLNSGKIALPEQLKAQPSHRADSKQAKILASLRAPAGATVDTMMKTTGWQQHSVRGFLAGVVRKKLKLNLVSEAGDDGRVYRITGDALRPQTGFPSDQV